MGQFLEFGTEPTLEGDEPEEAAMQDEPAAEDQEGEHHDINMDERMPTMSFLKD